MILALFNFFGQTRIRTVSVVIHGNTATPTYRANTNLKRLCDFGYLGGGCQGRHRFGYVEMFCLWVHGQMEDLELHGGEIPEEEGLPHGNIGDVHGTVVTFVTGRQERDNILGQAEGSHVATGGSARRGEIIENNECGTHDGGGGNCLMF